MESHRCLFFDTGSSDTFTNTCKSKSKSKSSTFLRNLLYHDISIVVKYMQFILMFPINCWNKPFLQFNANDL